MKEIVSTSKLNLKKVACFCFPGTASTNECNYARNFGIRRADGRNVGDILIAGGQLRGLLWGS